MLSALYQIQLMDILPALGQTVFVPHAVERELAAGRALGRNVPDVASFQWLSIRTAATKTPLPNLHQLDAGETEVLRLALELPNSVAVLDEAPARRIALQLGLRITGTLGLIVDAKKRGLIQLVGPVLRDLEQQGFHVSASIRRIILQSAGETP